MKPLIVIPARSGSKGVPGKNTRLLNGIPLIAYTIQAAIEVFEKDKICISTDSEYIVSIASRYGINAPFIRPAELATDLAPSYKVYQHALEYYSANGFDADVVVVLQPTSPFRTGFHIREAMKLYEANIDMVVSVKEAKANPYFVLFEENTLGYLEKSKPGDFLRRQDCPNVWEYNGAIYVINASSLRKGPPHKFEKVRKYVMDEFSSHDIDTPLDWIIAEVLAKHSSLE